MTRMLGSHLCFFLSVVSFCVFVLNFLNTLASPSDQHLCRPDQKNALLEFLNEFSVDEVLLPKTKSWKNGSDCCSWNGVICDAESGLVIGLDLFSSGLCGPLKPNSSLFRLYNLQSLNLAYNDFNSSSIPTEFRKFTRLIRLDLSYSKFSGQIPIELLQLTKLVSLNLSTSVLYPDLFTEKQFLSTLARNLTGLRELHLTNVNISSAVPEDFVNISSLSSLHVSGCNLVGEFPRSVFLLPRMESIILSFNHNLMGSLPQFRANSSLTMLDLSSTGFSGKLPPSIGNLKSMTSLDLSNTEFSGSLPDSIGNLNSLTSLDLSHTEFSGSLPDSIGNLNSMTLLDLSNTDFSGSLPHAMGNLRSLNYLVLSSSKISGSLPDSIGNLTLLSRLDLSSNNFVGEVPSSINNLNQLIHLSLSDNKLSGNFPLLSLNLTELSYIDLSYNHFKGPLPSNIGNISKLQYFGTGGNSFGGTLPLSLFKMTSLRIVDLHGNQLSGPLDFGNVSSSSMLQSLNLGGNNLNGPISRSISKFVNLYHLDLSFLNMSGNVDLSILSNLTALQILFLSGNNLSIANLSSTFAFPLHLGGLILSACDISEFPDFLRNQGNLIHLDLSSNRIKGQVPEWLWRFPNLDYVNLSHNSLSSFEGSPQFLYATNISILDLSSNVFQGPFPILPLSTKYLFASRNNFTGNIPRLICKLGSLEIVDLSNNNFSGSIPRCLGNFSDSLSVLNLRKNSLSGSLPKTFINGSKLRTLDVGHNQIAGKLPRSLINCTGLEVLNVESNRINDKFPFWLGALPELQVLILRSNGFHGLMSPSQVFFGFPKLRIIDISYNNFTANLPSDYFMNWSSMASIEANNDRSEAKYMGESYYHDSIVLMNKGLEMELVRILTIYTAIDFSGNRFQGDIPESIGLLKDLIVLNLSNNAFTGHIPPTLSNLTELESLDLSRNMLSGKIPVGLGNLSFLAYINVSHNQLGGPIPHGTQFQSQPSSSFEGNLGLCGPPLEKTCGDVNTPASQEAQPMEPEVENVSWIAAVIGYAPGLVLGLAVGHMVTMRKHEWFIKIFGRNRRRCTRWR